MRVDAQLLGVLDEIEHRVHSVLDRGWERVLGCTSIVHAAHDSVSVRDDRGCPPSIVLGSTKGKASTMEVDDDGMTAFIGVALVIVEISVSLEMTLILPWYVEREGDLSYNWGERGVDGLPKCRFEGSRVGYTMQDHPYFHQESPYRGLDMENPAGPCHISLRAPVSDLPIQFPLSLRTHRIAVSP